MQGICGALRHCRTLHMGDRPCPQEALGLWEPLDGGTRGALGTGPGSDSPASLLTPETQTLSTAIQVMLSSNFHNPPVFRVRGCPPYWLVLCPVGHRAWRAHSHNPPVLERAVESWLSRVASGSRGPTSGCPISAQLQAGLAGHGRQGLTCVAPAHADARAPLPGSCSLGLCSSPSWSSCCQPRPCTTWCSPW